MALAAAAAGCGPAAPTASPSPAARNVWTDGELVSACVPTGAETCFNAQDDNCNGVIDEGCGSSTGVLQFMIAWGDSPADVDLSVTEPSGAKAHKGLKTTPSGLSFEKNCPDEACHGQNVENVFFAGSTPEAGKYVVEAHLVDARAAELPVRVHLSARIGPRTYAADLVLSPEKDKDRRTLTFEL